MTHLCRRLITFTCARKVTPNRHVQDSVPAGTSHPRPSRPSFVSRRERSPQTVTFKVSTGASTSHVREPLRFPKCADSVAGVGCSAAEHRAAGCGRLLSDGERARRSSPTFLVMHLMPPESRRAQQVANTEGPLSLPPSPPFLPPSITPSLSAASGRSTAARCPSASGTSLLSASERRLNIPDRHGQILTLISR